MKNSTTPPRPLRGLRVIDLAVDRAELAGRLLSDLGADVIKVEPPGGSPSRKLPPLDPNNEDHSLFFTMRNCGKRSVVLDLCAGAATPDSGRFEQLLASADVLIDSAEPGTWAAHNRSDLSAEAVAERHRHLVVVSVTSYGLTGPYSGRDVPGSVIDATSGMCWKAGLPEREPLLPPGDISSDTAGLVAAFAAVCALLQRQQHGAGQLIDVSANEATAQITDWSLPNVSRTLATGVDPVEMRAGPGPVYTIIATKDGFVRLVVLSPRQWHAIRAWLGEPDYLQDPEYEGFIARLMIADAVLNLLYEQLFADMTMEEVSREAQRRGIVATPILKPGDVISNSHFESRGTFDRVPLTTGGVMSLPSGWLEINGARVGPTGRPPAVGEHTEELLAELDATDAAGAIGAADVDRTAVAIDAADIDSGIGALDAANVDGAAVAIDVADVDGAAVAIGAADVDGAAVAIGAADVDSGVGALGVADVDGAAVSLGAADVDGSVGVDRAAVAIGEPSGATNEPSAPLVGLRVADFGHGGVGVEMGRMLAEYGADVVKVESRTYPDFVRVVLGDEMSPSFASSSRSKRSFGVNAKTDEGRQLLLQMVGSGVDVVIENGSTGTMDNLGLGYRDFAGVNRDVVMVSSQLMGSTGEWADWLGYGPNTQVTGGMTYLWDYPNVSRPSGSQSIFPDHWAGRMGALAVVAAVLGQRRGVLTQGCHAEVCQVEQVVGVMGDLLARESLQPGSVTPQGNRRDRGVPWGLFRCSGEDQWVAICCRTDMEWDNLTTVAGIDNTNLSTVAARQERIDEVEELVTGWTVNLTKYEVTDLCLSAGVPAGPMLTSKEQLKDPHLQARGYVVTVDQPPLGDLDLEGPAFHATGMVNPDIRPAPALGAHTIEIAAQLGVSDSQIQHLINRGILETSTP